MGRAKDGLQLNYAELYLKDKSKNDPLESLKKEFDVTVREYYRAIYHGSDDDFRKVESKLDNVIRGLESKLGRRLTGDERDYGYYDRLTDKKIEVIVGVEGCFTSVTSNKSNTGA